MTTGRINQVAFLSDVGSVRDKRPCGSSARRGHDSRTCRAKTLPIGRSEARRPHARSMLRIRDHKQKLVDLHNLTTSRGLIGTQALLRCPPAAREGQEEERDNERHHSLTIASNSLTLSECLEWGAMPRPSQGMPRPRHANTRQGQSMTS
ncbi:unnamed protein product [Prunus brigantina]